MPRSACIGEGRDTIAESRRDQEEGGELDSHEKVRLSFAGSGDIKRREAVLDPQVSPEEIKRTEMELGLRVGLLSLRVVPRQQRNGHCPCDSAQARRLKQQLRSAQVAGQWRGDTALTLSLIHI